MIYGVLMQKYGNAMKQLRTKFESVINISQLFSWKGLKRVINEENATLQPNDMPFHVNMANLILLRYWSIYNWRLQKLKRRRKALKMEAYETHIYKWLSFSHRSNLRLIDRKSRDLAKIIDWMMRKSSLTCH